MDTMDVESAVELTGWEIMGYAILQLVMCFVSYKLEKAGSFFISSSTTAICLGAAFGAIMMFFSKKKAEQSGLDPDVFFYALLPPIILEAGFNTKKKGFFSNLSTILSLAVAGTLISALFTGFVLLEAGKAGLITPLSAAECFLFGSLISATDPVATLSVFKTTGAPPLLFNIVFGESMLNDGVAIVAFQVFARFVSNGDDITSDTTLVIILEVIGIMIGSLALAAIVCFISAFFLRKNKKELHDQPAIELSIIMLSAYLSYVLANVADLSGVVALFFSGVMMSHYHLYNISDQAAISLRHLLSMLAVLSENFIFLYLGTSVIAYSAVLTYDWTFIVIAVIVILFARLVNTFPLLAIFNVYREEPIPLSYMTVIWFAGLRGAVAFALALQVRTPTDPHHADIIKSTTLVTVLCTTMVLGMLTMPILKCFGLVEPPTMAEKWTENLSKTNQMFRASHQPMYTYPEPPTPGDEDLSMADAGSLYDSHVGAVFYDRGSKLHRWWITIDEKYLKPVLGGKIRNQTPRTTRTVSYPTPAAESTPLMGRDLDEALHSPIVENLFD